MRVCDKCQEKADYVISVDHQIFDLCKEHHGQVIQFLTVPEVKKRGPKPKNLESIN